MYIFGAKLPFKVDSEVNKFFNFLKIFSGKMTATIDLSKLMAYYY